MTCRTKNARQILGPLSVGRVMGTVGDDNLCWLTTKLWKVID